MPTFAQSLRCIRVLIIEIFNIFLWLFPLKRNSCALILNPAKAGNVFQRFRSTSGAGWDRENLIDYNLQIIGVISLIFLGLMYVMDCQSCNILVDLSCSDRKYDSVFLQVNRQYVEMAAYLIFESC